MAGLVGKVQKRQLRDDMICRGKTQAPILTQNLGDVDFMVRDSVSWGNYLVYCVSCISPCCLEEDTFVILVLRASKDSPGRVLSVTAGNEETVASRDLEAWEGDSGCSLRLVGQLPGPWEPADNSARISQRVCWS